MTIGCHCFLSRFPVGDGGKGSMTASWTSEGYYSQKSRWASFIRSGQDGGERPRQEVMTTLGNRTRTLLHGSLYRWPLSYDRLVCVVQGFDASTNKIAGSIPATNSPAMTTATDLSRPFVRASDWAAAISDGNQTSTLSRYVRSFSSGSFLQIVAPLYVNYC